METLRVNIKKDTDQANQLNRIKSWPACPVGRFRQLLYATLVIILFGCGKGGSNPPPPPQVSNFSLSSWTVNGLPQEATYFDINKTPFIRYSFGAPIDRNSISTGILFKDNSGIQVSFNTTYEKSDSVLILRPVSPLPNISKYVLTVSSALKSKAGGSFIGTNEISFITSIDSSDKFPVIADDNLLTLIQQQTFKYFWDFGHPTSGLARERNNSGDLVTSGGSGFGVMAILVGIHRGFITRAEGLARIQKIVNFLNNTAQKFHGAFPHWLNGINGTVIPFSPNDNGADLVETSYLVKGLLCARQYFNGVAADETDLRNKINAIYNGVEWDWFRQNNQNVLYWHWSPDKAWIMNHKIQGWNETLITYVLAASSTTHTIPKNVYDEGFARNGAIRNNNTYYGYQLPLGPPQGGPLFFAHYSFLGMDPRNLSDAYANYWTQNLNHTLINYNYCVTNPKKFFGYSSSVWGLTASDNQSGYAAHEPNNDLGVISPTAALSSMPYTPTESMRALKFFYYKLGDKLFKEYGFVDAFNLSVPWFASSFLAIDQGPIIIMIENHRSQLLWNLFTSCPEVKAGMVKLGFTAPYL